ncbi:MAG: putative toxin-antitoxin system toxin component, PIN family [Pyrinomonadaceae bacterium]|nr:putative toxin-antitoxin system toxin component, PIN family [Pyrinomonadaceae bacterium]
MIKTVIDTGITVSAAFRDRMPEEVILFIVEQEDFEWVISPAILEEYTEVLARKKFNLPPEFLQKWSEIFEQCTTTIEPEIEIDFLRDKKDAKFLECALAAEADYLITGDKDFEEAQKLVKTTIISVSQFKELVMEKWS